jgi:UDP-N-acetylglucosamine 4,6-dehydratase
MKLYNSILITGGTGSFGQEFVKTIIRQNKNLKRLVIYSRDELKQYEMSRIFSEKKYKFIRYFIGDVRDLSRLKLAMRGIECVIHAAALKQVPAAEYNPIEFIKTNVIGAQNIIEASLQSKIKSVIALSTDKACAPINLYGATKLCSDKLFIAANNLSGKSETKYSVVRYGNVFGSRGSVVPLFLKQKNEDFFTITHKEMTRFNISIQEGVNTVIWGLKNFYGGEILIPKIPSFKVIDLIKAIEANKKIKIIGIRKGEKLHEEMITISDSLNTIETNKYYFIINDNPNLLKYYKNKFKSKFVNKNFRYSSDSNLKFLSIKQLKSILKKYVVYKKSH